MNPQKVKGKGKKRRKVAKQSANVPAVPMSESVHEVLNIEHLLDRILDMVIFYLPLHNDCSKEKTLTWLRLVSRNMCASVNRLLRNKGEPLIEIFLDKEANNKLLNRFNRQIYSKYSADETKVPAFSLRIGVEYCENTSNLNPVHNFFKTCGKGMVKLDIGMVCDNISPAFSNADFPALKKLTFQTDEEVSICSANLIRHLLKASPRLKSFKALNNDSLFPEGAERFEVPSTLCKLELSILSEQELQFIANCGSPKLSKLAIFLVFQSDSQANYLYDVLNEFTKTLKDLKLHIGGSKDTIRIKFPVMEKVEILYFDVHNFELDEGTNVNASFPKLARLTLATNACNYQVWTYNSVFDQVTHLKLEVMEYKRPSSWGKAVSIKLHTAMLTRAAFPNVTCLSVVVWAKHVSVIRYIFKEFRQLVNLQLLVAGTDTIRDSNFWDGVLAGLSIGQVKAIKATKKTVKRNPSFASITNLQDLEHLELRTYDTNLNSENDTKLISGFAFRHAFLKLPDLCYLYLCDRFEVSNRLRNKMSEHFCFL